MKPHFKNLSLLSASNTIMITNEGGTQNASVPSRCRMRKLCLSAAQTDLGSQADGKRGEVRRRSRTCARKATTLAPLPLRFVGTRGFPRDGMSGSPLPVM
jgi:hypothetical protein